MFNIRGDGFDVQASKEAGKGKEEVRKTRKRSLKIEKRVPSRTPRGTVFLHCQCLGTHLHISNVPEGKEEKEEEPEPDPNPPKKARRSNRSEPAVPAMPATPTSDRKKKSDADSSVDSMKSGKSGRGSGVRRSTNQISHVAFTGVTAKSMEKATFHLYFKLDLSIYRIYRDLSH